MSDAVLPFGGFHIYIKDPKARPSGEEGGGGVTDDDPFRTGSTQPHNSNY